MASALPATTANRVLGSFGRLWGRGHEILHDRQILQVSGKGATAFLQNLVTSNLLHPPTLPKPEPADAIPPGVSKDLWEQQKKDRRPIVFNTDQLRATCFLDPKGRILTDSLLWKQDDTNYYIDVDSTASKDVLMQHLKQYKLRRQKVDIRDRSDDMTHAVIFGTYESSGTPPNFLSGLDPRHPSLGLRILQMEQNADKNDLSDMLSNSFPPCPENYALVRRLAGVAEGYDELHGRVSLETNQEFINAVDFDKGCYLGQELTARVHHTGVLRKRIVPIFLQHTDTPIPQPWSLAHSLQQGRSSKKFFEEELRHLPSRLPRMSVLTAGNMVAMMTGSMEPQLDDEAEDDESKRAKIEQDKQEWQKLQVEMEKFLNFLQEHCTMGTKLKDKETDQTIGQIVSPPVPGTNVALALMRLESIGLLNKGVWSKTNKVKFGDNDDMVVRYLPYLPLWWPEIDMSTGKAKMNNDYSDEARPDAEKNDDKEKEDGGSSTSEGSSPTDGYSRIEIEQLPLNDEKQ